MKTIRKYAWPFICFILLLCIAGMFFSNREAKKSLDTVIEHKTAELKIWKDKSRRYLAEKKAAEINLASAKKYYQEELKAAKRDLGIKDKRIQSLTKLVTESSGVARLEPKNGKLVFEGQWSSFSIDTNQNLSYVLRDSLFIAAHYKRDYWFGAKKLRIKAISYNPNTQIKGLDHIQISNAPSRFALSLTAGYGVTKDGTGPYVGIGISYDLIRF